MSMSAIRKLAHPMLASIFVVSGIDCLRDPDKRVDIAEPFLDKMRERVPALPSNDTAVRLNAVVQVGAGAMLAKGIAPRLSALVLAGSLVPTTIAGHPFWKSPKETKTLHKLQFTKNLSLLGGLLIAVADTNGKPSLAWRAQHVKRPDWVPDGR